MKLFPRRKTSFFVRFLAGLLIAGQLALGLPAQAADALRPSFEGIQSGLEEQIRAAGAGQEELGEALTRQTKQLLHRMLGDGENSPITADRLRRFQQLFDSASPLEKATIVHQIWEAYLPSIRELAKRRLETAAPKRSTVQPSVAPRIVVVGPAINLNLHIAWSPVAGSDALEIDLQESNLKANGSPTNVMEILALLDTPFLSVAAHAPKGSPVGEVFFELLEKVGISTQNWVEVSSDVDFVPTASVGAQGLDFRFIPPSPAWQPAELADYAAAVERSVEAVAREGPGGLLAITSRVPSNAPASYLPGLFRLGKERGLLVAYDPKVATLSDPSVREAILDCGDLHLIAPNLEEFSLLAGLPPGQVMELDPAKIVHAARKLIDRHRIPAFLISLGADGALLVDKDRVAYANTPPVPMVGPGGTGDAGLAGLVAHYTQRKAPEARIPTLLSDADFVALLRAYVAAGAAAVQMPGDESPTSEAIQKMERLVLSRFFGNRTSTGQFAGLFSGLEEPSRVYVPRLDREFYADPVVISPDNAGSDLYLRFILENPGLFRGKKVLELFTGSGVLAYALALVGADVVVATDILEQAIRLARRNQKEWPAEIRNRVTFGASDVYENLAAITDIRQFDVIIGNNPTMRVDPAPGDAAAFNTSAGERFEVPQKIVGGVQIWLKPGGDGIYITTRGIPEGEPPRRLTAQYLAGLVPAGWAVEPTGYEGMGRSEPVPIFITHVRPAAGAEEQPPWPVDAGKDKGAQEFKAFWISDAMVAKLADPEADFTQRALILAEHLGWSQEKLSLVSGKAVSMVGSWKYYDVENPYPDTVKKVSEALHANPIFLLTGMRRREAIRTASVARRIQLLRLEKGMTQDQLGQAADLDQNHVKLLLGEKIVPTRDTVFLLADALGESHVLIETGLEPPSDPRFRPDGDVGFANVGRQSRKLMEKAEALEAGLIRAWETAGLPASRWKDEIAAGDHQYPGLAVRLLNAKPGTLEQAVHYGLFSQGIAGKLREKVPLEESEIAELASDLAKAHKELEELFEFLIERLKPFQGYPNGRSHRTENLWDFIARLINRQRFLVLLRESPVAYDQFKAALMVRSDPEGAIVEKDRQVQELAKAFPLFTMKVVRRYVWLFEEPRKKLDEAQRSFERLRDLAHQGWIYPSADRKGYPVRPEVFAMAMIASGPAGADKYILPVVRRDAVIRAGLTAPASETLRLLAAKLPGLDSTLKGTETDAGYSEARDLLNRVVAWRQVTEPGFFAKLPDPELDDPAVVNAAGQPLIQQITRLIQAEPQLPQTPEELDPFLQKMATALTAAGAEELQPRLLAALERLQRRAEKLVKLLPAKKEIETSSSPIHIDPVIEKLTVLMRTLLAHPSPPAAAEQVKGILRAVDRQILTPGLRGLREPLVSSGYFPWPVFYYVHSLPHAEDWLVFPAGTFHSNEHLYQAQQRAIAAYSQRASALAFGRNGPHLRTSPFGPDSIDVETAPDLLVGFIHFLKNRLEQVNRSRQQGKRNDRLEKETREYVGALWNGLMVPTIGQYDKKDYEEAYFSLLREAAGKVGVNLSQILGLSIRLFPKFLPKEKMPDFLRFRNEVFLQEEIAVGYVGYLAAVHDEPQTGVAPAAPVSVWDLTVGTESADPYIERLRKNWDNPEQMEALEKIYRFLHQQANAGVEEQRRETRPAVPETRWTVIGPSVVKHFSGLEEFAGIERRVLIDPGNPEGRAQMLVQMGEAGAGAAHYYGGLEEAGSLAAMSGRFMEIVPHSPREPGFLNQMEQSLIQAGLPTELIAAGIEALAAGAEELRQAA